MSSSSTNAGSSQEANLAGAAGLQAAAGQPPPQGGAPPQAAVNQAGGGAAPPPPPQGGGAAAQGDAPSRALAQALSLLAQRAAADHEAFAALARAFSQPAPAHQPAPHLAAAVPAAPAAAAALAAPAAAAVPAAPAPQGPALRAAGDEGSEDDGLVSLPLDRRQDIAAQACDVDLGVVAQRYRDAVRDAAMLKISLPDQVKWAYIKPAQLKAEGGNLRIPELLITVSNVYTKLLLDRMANDRIDAENIASLFADFIASVRVVVSSQLKALKAASNAPAEAEAYVREVFAKMFDMVNPIDPRDVEQELLIRERILNIAVATQRLNGGERKGSGGARQSGGRNKSGPRGGNRSGSRGGRGGHGSGNGASSGQAPAAQP